MSVVPPDVSRHIDMARGMAALGVIWGHSMYSLGMPVELNGAFWVWVFLPISGYLVGRGFLGGSYAPTAAGAGRFLWNRALRILPLAWAALAVGWLVAFTRGTVPADVWRQFLFVPDRNVMSLVGPLWTIATEMQFYVFAAVVMPILARGRPWQQRAAGVVALLATVWVARALISATWDNDVQPRTLLGNLPFFVAGLSVATWSPVMRLASPVKVAVVASLVAGAWYLQNYEITWFWRWDTYKGAVYGGGAAVAAILAVVVVGTSAAGASAAGTAGRAAGGVVGAALAWCGVRTYGIYVYHALLLVVNAAWLEIPTGGLRLAWLLLALPLAAVSFRWFETPVLRFKIGRGVAPIVPGT